MKASITSPGRLSEIVEYLVDDSVGVIRDVLELPLEAGSPNFFHFYVRACNTEAFCEQANSANAGGAAMDRGKALAKAIGEAVERYCSAIFQREDFPLFSFESAPFSCVAPDEFALFSQQQYSQEKFPYRPFEKTTMVRWTPALDLTNGGVFHVPASMVFVPYFYEKTRGEFPIMQPISTGLACHDDPMRAAISAICEVVERDAFTITWQAKISPPQVPTESLSAANRDLVARLEAIGAHVSLFNLPTDHGIPVVFSVLQNTALDAPALAFANSSSLDPEEAVRKSLEELAHSYRFCRLLKSWRSTFVPTRKFANVIGRDSHVALHCDHANTHLSQFIFASSERISFSKIPNKATGDLKQDLTTVVKQIAKVNHRVLLADVTTADVQSLGLSVMRALVPGFHPLMIGHRFRAQGGRRLWEIPQKLGYPGLTKKFDDNPVPHPLP